MDGIVPALWACQHVRLTVIQAQLSIYRKLTNQETPHGYRPLIFTLRGGPLGGSADVRILFWQESIKR